MTKFNEKLLRQRVVMSSKIPKGKKDTYEVAHEKTVLAEKIKTTQGKDVTEVFVINGEEIINTSHNWTMIIQALKERYEALTL